MRRIIHHATQIDSCILRLPLPSRYSASARIAASFVLATAIALAAGCNSDKVSGEPSLSGLEVSSLSSMQMQQRMARDLYLELHGIWADEVFRVNAAVDQRHLDQLQTLGDEFNFLGPADSDPPGQFFNPDVQRAYDALLAAGSANRIEALRAGVEVEENAALDLDRWSNEVSLRDELVDAYRFIACESRNQLRSFNAELVASGGSYEPTRMSPAGFALLVGLPVERC